MPKTLQERKEFDRKFIEWNNPENNQWRKEGRRADYFEPDAIVFPINIVSILLSQQAEKQREEVEKAYQRGYYEGTLVNNKYEDNLRAN